MKGDLVGISVERVGNYPIIPVYVYESFNDALHLSHSVVFSCCSSILF